MIITKIRDFRKDLSDYINKAQEKDQSIFIMRADEPVAILLGMERIEEIAKRGDKKILEEIKQLKFEAKKGFNAVRKSLLEDIEHFYKRSK